MKRVISKGHSRHTDSDLEKIMKAIKSWIIEYVTKHNKEYDYSWRAMIVRKKGYWGQPNGGLDALTIK